jgi:hypothetical protein
VPRRANTANYIGDYRIHPTPWIRDVLRYDQILADAAPPRKVLLKQMAVLIRVGVLLVYKRSIGSSSTFVYLYVSPAKQLFS